MRFLIDENIPVELIKFLKRAGHDAVRVSLSSSDSEVGHRSLKENRIVITLDKDFIANPLIRSMKLDVIHVQVQPPHEDLIIKAFGSLLKSLPESEFKRIIILNNSGHIHIL